MSRSAHRGADQTLHPGALRATASATVVIAALLVQRDCLGKQEALIPWLWGTTGIVALIVWQWAARIVPPPAAAAAIELPAISRPRRRAFQLVLGVAVGALVSGVTLLWRDLLSSAGAWLWFTGLSSLAISVAIREARVPRLRPLTANEWLSRWLAVVVVVAAFVLRIYRLDTIPPTFLQDEGAVADWGLSYLHHTPVTGQHVATAITLFRNGVVACPLLGSYLYALAMQLAGETTFGLRLTAAVCGGLTVWVFYLIASSYLSRWAALAATVLLAASHVHMHWSRLGMQQSMNTLAATLVMWFTLRGLRSPGYLSFVLGGLCLGTAQYLYEGARFLVPILGLFFAYMALTDRQFMRQRAAHIVVMAATAMAVFAPFGIWFYQNPGALLGRSREVFIFDQPVYLESRYPGLTATQVVLAQLRRSLLGFAYFGDGSGAFDELQVPLIDPVAGALVLAGILGFSLRPRRPVDALVALWIWIPIAITCTVTVDPPPMTRLIMVFPALFFVAGAMLDRLGWLLGQAARRTGLVDPTLALVVAGVSWAALWNCRTFFIDYPRTAPPDLWTEAGHLARAAGPTSKTFMVSPMHIYFYSPEMRFLARGLVGADVPIGGIPVHERGYRDGLFLVSPALPDAVERLRTSYPHGQLAEHRDLHDRLLFTAYRVDATEMNAAAPADAPWQQYDLRFGMGGKAFGEFQNPSGLAVGREGFIYVADTGNGRIDVFDSDGQPVAALGRLGSGEGEFQNLCAVAAAADGNLLGLDCKTRWIKRFARSGRWLGNFGGPDQLTTPSGLAVAPDGSVVVADAGEQSIFRFDSTGALVARAGASEDGPGSVKPAAIAVRSDGTVYVIDNATAHVQRFSAQLEYQLQWSLPRAQAGTAIAVADAVYVTDPARGSVQRYTLDGDVEWTVGAAADDPARLLRPTAVATDAKGSVYVLDGGRNQVFRYDVTRQPP